MNIQFNSLEILKMAISVEEDGEQFYQKCVAANSEPEVKKIFSKLAQQEREHQKYFKKLLKDFDEADSSVSRDYLYQEITSDYLKSLVDNQVFPDDEQATDEIAANLAEAIEIGIKAEKNSILLYQELVDTEKDPQTIKALKKLVEEEKEHLVRLKNLKKYV
ncbi:MAG: ferritin-like domain-containing protein [Bacillota bacterium]